MKRGPVIAPKRRLVDPLRPGATAGVSLLALGAALLLWGRAAFAADPSRFEDWVVGLGLILLLGALVITLVLPSPVIVTSPRVAPDVGFTTTPAPAGDVAPQAPAPAARAPGSSIPAAYIAALYNPPTADGRALIDYPEPIAAALPFAAMPRPPSQPDGPASTGGEGLSLEIELARLRTRVQELEADGGAYGVPAWYAARSGASSSIAPITSTGAPAPLGRGLLPGGTGCVGCGTSVPAQARDSLCGGCGRPLCTTCGGRPGSSAGLRRCPDCRNESARTGALSVSGGRAASPVMPGPSGPRTGGR
ncbi:MAG: hypothetical protein L3K17_00145 [Thermoplasmata archaeon]|nr:hypothetical protein [Thermoplasmata archaeon]